MRRRFPPVLLVLALALGAAVPAVAEAPAARVGALRQVAGILDYVAGDYRAAVSETGQILSEPEYAEQRSLAADADALAARAGLPTHDPLRASLAKLAAALGERRPPAEIASLCREARGLVASLHGVELVPAGPARRVEGERLYRAHGCPACHGEDGGAQTEQAKTLTPPPASFLDPERVGTVSPHRAFFAIGTGVAGTAMVGYPQLTDAERWDLAFYVLSLRHPPEAVARGRAVFERAGRPIDVSPQALSALGEEDVVARLRGRVPDPERDDVLAFVRAAAPFESTAEASAESFGAAREAVAAALVAYRGGDRGEARRLLVGAYLDGFEPYEAALAARDPALVRDVERAMLELREAVAGAETVADVEAAASRVEALLARAGERPGDATTALVAAFTITLREGLEIVLLVGGLLALVRRQGLAHLVRWVHAGWLAAIPAGAATWFAAGSLLGGLERELAEGIAALVAAVVLLGVTHWAIGQVTARRFMGAISDGLGRVAQGRTAAIGVASLSFVAAYREAFEIVLFFQALLLDSAGAEARVALGIAIGIATLLCVAFALRTLGRRLQPRPLLLLSSVLLALVSFAMLGKGVRALQEADVLPLHSLPLPELPVLGIHASVEGLVAQALGLLVIFASTLVAPKAKTSHA